MFKPTKSVASILKICTRTILIIVMNVSYWINSETGIHNCLTLLLDVSINTSCINASHCAEIVSSVKSRIIL